MDLVNIIGKMEATIKEVLKLGFEAVTESGKKGWVQVINMKDNLRIIKNKDMVFILGRAVTCTKVIIETICDMATERCFGKMEVFIREAGSWIFKMAKGNFSMEHKN
jgi:hypothetical protein